VNISERIFSARFPIAFFEARQEALFGLAIERVENFRHHFVGIALGGAGQVRHELPDAGSASTFSRISFCTVSMRSMRMMTSRLKSSGRAPKTRAAWSGQSSTGPQPQSVGIRS